MALFDTHRLLAVVRFREACDLDAVVDALRRGGIGLLEITADTPGALEAVRLANLGGAPIGAGTIRSSDQARSFADAGAAFLVGPGFVPEVVRTAVELGVPVIPGALSPSEVSAAAVSGATAVKLFPAGLGGPAYLRALRGPFPDVAFVPTGEIELEAVPAWLEAGAACVGIGAALVGEEPPRSAEDLDRIAERAGHAVALAAGSP